MNRRYCDGDQPYIIVVWHQMYMNPKTGTVLPGKEWEYYFRSCTLEEQNGDWDLVEVEWSSRVQAWKEKKC